MVCDPKIFETVPLFQLLDADERAVLAENTEIHKYAALERIYKIDDPGGKAYIMLEGSVRVTLIDEDHTDIILDEPQHGDLFGWSSMLADEPHQSTATAKTDCTVIEIDRKDITVLLQKKPMAGLDIMTVLGRQMHYSQNLLRQRVARNANDMIDEKETLGERIADGVARFGGSWRFIISFGVVLIVYTAINVILGQRAWDPYPFILLNLFLSMLASIQAPVIMMSQNRQDSKDRLRSELDYQINRKAEMEITQLLEKVSEIRELIQK